MSRVWLTHSLSSAAHLNTSRVKTLTSTAGTLQFSNIQETFDSLQFYLVLLKKQVTIPYLELWLLFFFYHLPLHVKSMNSSRSSSGFCLLATNSCPPTSRDGNLYFAWIAIFVHSHLSFSVKLISPPESHGKVSSVWSDTSWHHLYTSFTLSCSVLASTMAVLLRYLIHFHYYSSYNLLWSHYGFFFCQLYWNDYQWQAAMLQFLCDIFVVFSSRLHKQLTDINEWVFINLSETFKHSSLWWWENTENYR